MNGYGFRELEAIVDHEFHEPCAIRDIADELATWGKGFQMCSEHYLFCLSMRKAVDAGDAVEGLCVPSYEHLKAFRLASLHLVNKLFISEMTV